MNLPRFLLPLLVAASSAWAALPVSIKDKTLVVWVSTDNLSQQGSGVLSLENAGRFDGIVLGELAPQRWMAGSDNYARTQKGQEINQKETAGPEELIQIAAVYQDRTVRLYRNGEIYAEYEIDEPAEFDASSTIAIGLRHRAMMTGFFSGSVEEARLYDVALSADTLKALKPNVAGTPAPIGFWTFEDGKTVDVMGNYPEGMLNDGAVIENGRLVLDGNGGYFLVQP